MSTPDVMRRLLEQATRELRRLRAENEQLRPDAIAVVGLACRFPGGAHDPDAFWRLLVEGRDVVREVPPERWPPDPELTGLRGARWAALLDLPLADFDAEFFAISPREAASLDPQQRLLLEVAWEALEDAAIALDRLPGRDVGVFAGVSNLDYRDRVDRQPLDAYSATGNLHSTAAGRISHCLDLQGPCLAVDTACSSSLVAVHLAIQSLQRRECAVALAGGVNLLLSPRMMEKVARTQSLAPNGRCKTFDARADGFVRAEGCGVVALKRLADALADGDPIRAVLRGSAVGHDGRSAGFTAPNPLAQARLFRAALAHAGLQPHEVSCIEAHGTGTALGDAIEAEALQAVYGPARPDGSRCALASLKPNLGHMEAAAGVAGLIKLILALGREQILPHLHLETQSPRIRLDDGALEIPTRPRTWPRGQVPRRAAVNAFGIAGTNAHVLVEEAPPRPSPNPTPTPPSPAPVVLPASPPPSPAALSSSPPSPAPVVLLAISARSPGALRDLLARHRERLTAAAHPLPDLAHAIAISRTQEPFRRALVGRSAAELIAASLADRPPAPPARGRPRIVFVCPGEGSQRPGMGLRLCAEEPAFRDALHACAAAIRRHGDWDLLAALAADRLDDTDRIQPALWAYTLALAAQWRAWGVVPDALIGHGIGEVAAAHLAGALDLDDAARVICTRSREAGLADALTDLSPGTCTIPMHSTLDGRRLEGHELGADHWVRDLREPVRLADVVQGLAGDAIFIELGPHPVLAPALDAALAAAGGGPSLASVVRDRDEPLALRSALGAVFEAGHPITWERPDPTRPRVPLPHYPWQRETFWIDLPRTPEPAAPRGLPGLRRVTAHDPDLHLWETTLAHDDPTVADHRIDGRVVMPAASQLEMLVRALAELGGAAAWTIHDLRFERPLELGDTGPAALQLSIRAAGTRGSATLHARGPGQDEWLRHLSARLERRLTTDLAAPAPSDLAAARARCTRRIAPADHAAQLTELGLTFGPGTPRIDEIAVGPGECLLHARLPEGEGDPGPALLDACFQALHIAAGSPPLRHFPVRIAALRTDAARPAAVWCHAVLRPAEGRLRGDLVLHGPTGPIAHITGLEAHPVLAPQNNLHAVTWIAAPPLTPLAPTHLQPTPSTPTHLRIAGDPPARADALARRLAAHGATATCHALAETAAFTTTDSPATLVVLIPDAPPEDPARAAARTLDGLVTLIRVLVRRGDRDPPRLVLVTRGAQPAGGAPGDRLDHAPAWGLGRSVMHEHPELRCTLLDLDPAGPDDDETDALARELLALGPEDQLALRRPPAHDLSLRPSPTLAPHDLSLRPSPTLAATPHDLSLRPSPTPPVLRLVARLRRADMSLGTSPAGARAFALAQEQPGVLDGLALRACPRRAPGPGEVELAVLTAGLNFLDVLLALDVLRDDDDAAPPLGSECVGVVTAIGPGVGAFRPGDRVIALAPGCFASHVLAREALCVPLPPDLSTHAAATLPIAGLTAVYALDHVARVRPGERVLIHAAAGGVGLLAVQLALARGAEVFATAGSPAKRQLLRERGAHHVGSSRDLSFVDLVRRETRGEGVDIVLNSLAGDLLAASVDLLRPGGRFVELGKRDYADDRPLGLRPFLRRISWSLVDLRGMLREAPEQVRALLDALLALIAAGTLAPLPHRVVPIAAARDAFAAMARGDHTGKLLLDLTAAATTPIAPPRGRPVLRDDGVVLVTGGTGRVGLALAGWLVDHGVRRLALLARRAPDDAALAAIEALRRGPSAVDANTDVPRTAAASIRIQILRADVVDLDALAAALADLEGPLVGVLHAAGEQGDETLLSSTPERLARVAAPTIAGAWNLHRLTLDRPLELFVLCSSAGAVLGSPGRAGHTGADAFLGALAGHRRARGLPALCVDWGAWDPAGLPALAPRGEPRAGQGLQGMSHGTATALLGRLLEQGATQRAAMHLHPRRWRESHLAVARAPFLSDLSEETPTTRGALRGRLAALPPGDRLTAVQAHLREQVARVLRRDLARLDLDAPLQQTGLDSLMAVELRNRLESDLGLALSVTLIWRHPSIRALAEFLAPQLADPPSLRTTAPTPEKPAQPAPPTDDAHAGIARFLAAFTRLARDTKDDP